MTSLDGEPGEVGPVALRAWEELLTWLREGRWESNRRLGSERDIAVAIGVSRSTLRKVLDDLETQGLVRRVTGRAGGVFATATKVERNLSRIVGVPELLREQGFTAGSRIVSVSVQPCDARTAQGLGIPMTSFIVEIVRIRLADGQPISLETARLPADLVPGLPERDLSGSLYELLDREYSLRAGRATERIEVMTASESEASILDVPLSSPLLAITRTTVTQDGVAFEFSLDLFRADRTRIVVTSPAAAEVPGDATPGSALSGDGMAGRVVVLHGRPATGQPSR